MNWHRHGRFLIALAVGLAAAVLLPMETIDRTLAGGNLFFATYLVLSAHLAHRLTSADLRRDGTQDDEGGHVIVLLAVGAVVMCLWAVLATLADKSNMGWTRPLLAIASVPLGWATLHMVMAFHYAWLFYAPNDAGRQRRGLDFPETPDPGPWDFIYFSMVLGMAAETSDVTIQSSGLRRIVVLHSILSFFFNTVILALAVNVAVLQG